MLLAVIPAPEVPDSVSGHDAIPHVRDYPFPQAAPWNRILAALRSGVNIAP
jgi:hypothetical protein